MNEDQLLELAPLAALGALDGEERAAFEAGVASSPRAAGEMRAFEELAGRIGLATAPVPPSLALRGRVLAAVTGTESTAARGWGLTVLAAAALAALAVGAGVLLRQRNDARREAAALRAENEQAREDLATLREHLGREAAVRELISHPESRIASLAGLPAAPGARGRVVWNAARREAVLVASGLVPAPPGKAYEVWVIGQAAPVPAGVFQVGAEGGAVYRLPPVDELARVKTFAVTLEPAVGTPAPTGPMVLAGAAS
jgi:anti-sigma-K factor RskA